jgi:hypothetical protein
MKRTLFDDAEIAEHGDFNSIGEQSQAALDAMINDAIGYPAHWAAFTVAQKSAQEVTISAGRYVTREKIYGSDASFDLNLQIYIPLISNDERWVALILRGEEVTVNAPRNFETSEDPETSIPVNRQTPKTIERRLTVIVQQGNATPAPALKPVIAETDAVIAMVLLRSTGIQTIEPGESWRVKSLYEVEGRVTALEVNLDSLFQRTTSIETDIANITSRLSDIPNPIIIRQMQRDIGATRRILALPDEQRAYVFDPGLTYDIWDTAHASWLARVREGIRFSYANESTSQLSVVNEDDPKIMIGANRRMVPAYDEALRIANIGTDAVLNISQQVHTVVDAIERSVSRTAIRYGTVKKVCTNNRYWANLTAGLRIGEMFTLNGEEFEVVNAQGGVTGQHTDKWRYIRQVIREEWTETYWDYETSEVGVNGSVYGQTFLNSQPMVLTSIDLNFVSVGAAGDVHLFVCETNAAGMPIFDKVLGHVTVIRNNLVVGWNKFALPLTMLESGKRYAFFTVTTGNHSIYATTGNKFTGGSRFYATDGAWAQGDAASDIAFRLYAAKFRDVRTVVPFNNLTLENGMTDIEIVMKSWAPGGTALEWEIKPSGATEWTTFEEHPDTATHPLVGLPALVELRLVMLGTVDLAPMIVLDTALRGRTGRHRGDMVAVSDSIAFGLSTETIVTQFTVDAFIPAEHEFTPKIIVGTDVLTADATVVEVDPDEPERRTFTSTFELGAPATAARMRPEMTTDNPVNVPFIQDCFIAAL